MRLQLFAALVVITFAANSINIATAEKNHVKVNNQVYHSTGTRKLTDGGEWVSNIESEERGVSLESANNIISRLRARVNAKSFAGATEKLSGAQVKIVSKKVAAEVKKDPKVWPIIKKGLKILYGTLLFGLIAAGVYAMLQSMHNYN